MNLSGQSVKRCIDFFKLPSEQVIVVCDDVALPFSKLRLKDRGSSGGHNGLKNIEMYLGSDHYIRLKIGIGRQDTMDLADYVLNQFDPEELKSLPEVIEQAKRILLVWLKEGYVKAVEQLGMLRTTSLPPLDKKPLEDKKNIMKDDLENI
jgi:PTH1 family peptidyl-tRNA hydrolase